MSFFLNMPKLSPTMTEGMIVKWHVQVGEQVQPGQLLLEIATDKATVEHHALDKAWIRYIEIREGDSAKVNDPLAILSETFDENIDTQLEQLKKNKEVVVETKLNETSDVKVDATTAAHPQVFIKPLEIPQPVSGNFFTKTETPSRILISPLAKKIAEDKQLDVTSIVGSGPGGRIVESDLEKASPKAWIETTNAKNNSYEAGSYESVKMSPVRKKIAERLQYAKSFIPHFYLTLEVDAHPLEVLRNQLKSGGVGVSLNDLIVKACAIALSKHPLCNSGFDPNTQTILNYKTIDIAIAVSIDQGVITPIVRFADCKSVQQISSEIKSLARKAKENRLAEEEYKGGSFTVSNLGMFGITSFQAILNPPQSMILAVGASKEVATVKDGQIVVGKIMNISLSCDHRVVDGVLGAQFLNTVKKVLENPSLLLL